MALLCLYEKIPIVLSLLSFARLNATAIVSQTLNRSISFVNQPAFAGPINTQVIHDGTFAPPLSPSGEPFTSATFTSHVEFDITYPLGAPLALSLTTYYGFFGGTWGPTTQSLSVTNTVTGPYSAHVVQDFSEAATIANGKLIPLINAGQTQAGIAMPFVAVIDSGTIPYSGSFTTTATMVYTFGNVPESGSTLAFLAFGLGAFACVRRLSCFASQHNRGVPTG